MKHERVYLSAAALFWTLGAVTFAVPGMRFSAYFLLGLGGLCLLWVALGRLEKKHRFFRTCKRIFLVGICAGAVVLECFEIAILRGGRAEATLPEADAVIVLGAGVNGRRPSLALQSRIDKAAEYIFADGNEKIPIVLSGGQGSGEDISEAEAMYRALTSHPLRPTDTPHQFLLEDRSTNTAENFAFSKAMLEEHGVDTETAVIAVVTNDFHIFRAELIARREGLTTVGIPAELPWRWLTANYYLRESFALVKTLLFD